MRHIYSIIIIITLAASILFAQPGTISSHLENSRLTRDLSGMKWKMKQMHPGGGVKAGLHKLPPADLETHFWNPAEVPGDVYTDLWKAGVIDDPYFGRNSVRAQWVALEEWWYALQFSVTEDIADKKVRLEFDGVDYSCDVWLNGAYLGRHEGAFSPFAFDVTHVLNSSKDKLASQNMLMVKLDPPPQVNAKVAGRKTPWFGDYWRDLVPFGIWRPVRLVASGAVRVDDLFIKPDLKEDGSATVEVQVTLENTSTVSREMTLIASIQGENCDAPRQQIEWSETVAPGTHRYSRRIEVKEPRLWWPWDLGKPNLYRARLSVKQGQINHDFSETTFGIRKIDMRWNPGFTKDEVSFPRTVMINGKMHFIRSACWGGPPDIFVGRTSVDEYRTLIRLAKEANMNNIRIFGWHPPEIPEFYQLCDSLGLTVWQDVIPLGTANIPQRQSFIDSTIAEAVAVIKERRNHPCLILIEGGEEAFLRTADPQFTKDFLLALGDSVTTYLDLPYVPDSPLTYPTARSVGYKAKEAEHALAYFYSMGRWLMEDYFFHLDFPIIPELAITSVPNVESLKKFIPENELWPPGLSWGHHWADLQRLRMQNFDTFGDERTGSLHEFVAATQESQGTIFQIAVEHFRRNKPRTSGVALCHFITYWPDMKWGIIDNYQQPKRSYEYVKRAYQPLLISLKFSKRRWQKDESFAGEVWIVNDLYESWQMSSAVIRLLDENGAVVKEEMHDIQNIEANSSKAFFSFEWPLLASISDHFNVELELRDHNGELLSANQYLFLIGDQQAAAAKMKAMGEEMRRLNGAYTYGNYYRFFPDMSRENGRDRQSYTETPRAKGFEQEE